MAIRVPWTPVSLHLDLTALSWSGGGTGVVLEKQIARRSVLVVMYDGAFEVAAAAAAAAVV